jgi:cbb3-type cytochrome oxidase subunit 3
MITTTAATVTTSLTSTMTSSTTNNNITEGSNSTIGVMPNWLVGFLTAVGVVAMVLFILVAVSIFGKWRKRKNAMKNSKNDPWAFDTVEDDPKAVISRVDAAGGDRAVHGWKTAGGLNPSGTVISGVMNQPKAAANSNSIGNLESRFLWVPPESIAATFVGVAPLDVARQQTEQEVEVQMTSVEELANAVASPPVPVEVSTKSGRRSSRVSFKEKPEIFELHDVPVNQLLLKSKFNEERKGSVRTGSTVTAVQDVPIVPISLIQNPSQTSSASANSLPPVKSTDMMPPTIDARAAINVVAVPQIGQNDVSYPQPNIDTFITSMEPPQVVSPLSSIRKKVTTKMESISSKDDEQRNAWEKSGGESPSEEDGRLSSPKPSPNLESSSSKSSILSSMPIPPSYIDNNKLENDKPDPCLTEASKVSASTNEESAEETRQAETDDKSIYSQISEMSAITSHTNDSQVTTESNANTTSSKKKKWKIFSNKEGKKKEGGKGSSRNSSANTTPNTSATNLFSNDALKNMGSSTSEDSNANVTISATVESPKPTNSKAQSLRNSFHAAFKTNSTASKRSSALSLLSPSQSFSNLTTSTNENKPLHPTHIALHTFHPGRKSDEIPITTGDLIHLLEKYQDGWGRGINLSKGKKEGMFPLSCLKMMKKLSGRILSVPGSSSNGSSNLLELPGPSGASGRDMEGDKSGVSVGGDDQQLQNQKHEQQIQHSEEFVIPKRVESLSSP